MTKHPAEPADQADRRAAEQAAVVVPHAAVEAVALDEGSAAGWGEWARQAADATT